MMKRPFAITLGFSWLAIFAASGNLPAQQNNQENNQENNQDQKKKSNLRSILGGTMDPTTRRREVASPVGKPGSNQASPRRDIRQRAANIKNRIEELRKKGYGDLEAIKSPKEAAGKIAELKKRRESLDAKFQGETAETTKDAVKAASGFAEKWSSIAKSLTDGKNRTNEEWKHVYERSIKDSAASDTTPAAPQGTLDYSFEGTRKVLDQATKPRGVSAELWARIQDQFFKELAELQAKVASAQKRVKDQQQIELKSIDRAIADAEKNFNELAEAKNRPSDAQLRSLAWQLHRARLAELIALYNRLMLADQDAEGLPNKIQIAIKPLNPSETLEDVARQIETSNRPGAPKRGQFDDYDGEGLPDLFPSDPELDKMKELLNKGEFYGNVLKSRMDRNRRLLESLNKELVNLNPNSVIDQERKKQIQNDIQGLIKQNTKDSAALETMQPPPGPKKATPKVDESEDKQAV